MNAGERKRGRPRQGTPQGVTQLLLLRPVLIDACGGDRGAALLLSQVLNWSIAPDSINHAEFFASNGALMATTGLSEDAFRSGRERLRALGFLHVEKRDAPPRIYYRLERGALENAVRSISDREAQRG